MNLSLSADFQSSSVQRVMGSNLDRLSENISPQDRTKDI